MQFFFGALHQGGFVVILDNGKIAFQGSVQEVRASTDPLVFQYVNERPDGPVQFHYPVVTIDEDFGIATPFL